MQTQVNSASQGAMPQVRPLTEDEVSAIHGGLVILAALGYIWTTAQTSTGGNSDISSWMIP